MCVPVISEDSLVNETMYMPMIDEETVICTPRKGDWNGGDNLLMTIPKLDRRKGNSKSIFLLKSII